jgi:4-amino-4-deoxy-L-arabinose transferase-like glycosyltransferase
MRLRPEWGSRAKRQVLSDVREDPYLGYILLGALVLAAFWFWHRIPVFATWDEKDRVLDPLVAYGSVLSNPGWEGLQEGIAWGREPWGGTFYLYALAVFPVVLGAVVTGNVDAITGIGFPDYTYAHYEVWAATPRWVWTWSLVFVRLTNVILAVATVYLTYRLGTELWDRATGRLAALMLALTLGFLKLAKEGGEDMPATFLFLLAVYLLVRYLKSGRDRWLYRASAAGGLALAFKLTMAPIVPAIGLAHLLKSRSGEGSWLRSFWRPRLLATGAGIGLVVLLLGFAELLVGDFDHVASRLFLSASEKVDNQMGPTAPLWWWYLRTYVSGFGLPLFLGTVAGLGGSLYLLSRRVAGLDSLRERAPQLDATALLVGALGLFFLLVSTWHDWRVHHILPTFPLLFVLSAWSFRRFGEYRPTVTRVALALVLVTTAIYSGVGIAGYASVPRDDATEWLNENADRDATMETYYHGFIENAVPHWMELNPVWHENDTGVDPCPDYIQVGYKDLLYLQDIPEDQLSADVDTNVANRSEYIRTLVDGGYNYTIVAEFGERPDNFVPERPTPGSVSDLIPLGIHPHSDQYGDEQEFSVNQYVAIMQLDGKCVESREAPW